MDKRRPGRPMDLEKSRRIEAATWQLLANEGYHALTFEAIAAKVGCNRPTIYRRYTSKAHLVASGAAQHAAVAGAARRAETGAA